ncbi:MAG: citrate/2-methylcitrate synthase [Dehalococcoidia bacterium]
MENIPRGLKDVVVDTSETSYIDGEAGKLYYRGYSIHDLAEQSSFEEVAHLLCLGKLPTRAELADFDASLKAARAVPPEIIEVLRLVSDAHPTDALRTAISALAPFDPELNDSSYEANLNKAVRLTAKAPTIIAAHNRLRNGQEPLPPDPDLSHAANFLYMLYGRRPNWEEERAIDVDLILHAEHGSNASAFAARITASTMADLHAAIVSAIAALKGPLHGGAAEAVMYMEEEIGEPERVDKYIHEMLAQGRKIMGMGHRIYKVEDPRARHLRQRARDLGERSGQPQWYRILERIAEVTAPLRAKGIFLNVDFYAGAVYHLLGIPEDMFVSMFAMGRMPGWIAQVLEQWQDNVLIRPRLKYTGPKDLAYAPIDQRG